MADTGFRTRASTTPTSQHPAGGGPQPRPPAGGRLPVPGGRAGAGRRHQPVRGQRPVRPDRVHRRQHHPDRVRRHHQGDRVRRPPAGGQRGVRAHPPHRLRRHRRRPAVGAAGGRRVRQRHRGKLDALSGTGPTNTVGAGRRRRSGRLADRLTSSAPGSSRRSTPSSPPTGATGTGTTSIRKDHIFKTTDGGVTFSDVTGGLEATGSVVRPGQRQRGAGERPGRPGQPGQRADHPAVQPGPVRRRPDRPRGQVNGQPTYQDVLLAGGRGGVYRLNALPDGNGGRLPATWTEFGTGLPNVTVYDLSVNEYQYTISEQERPGRSARPCGGWASRPAPSAGGCTPSRTPPPSPPAPCCRTAPNPPTPYALAAASVRIDGVTAAGVQGPRGDHRRRREQPGVRHRHRRGKGAQATFERSTIQGFNFVGSATLADRLDIAAGTQAGGDLNFIRFPISVDLGNTKGDVVQVSNGNKASRHRRDHRHRDHRPEPRPAGCGRSSRRSATARPTTCSTRPTAAACG